ncbi:MAG: BrnT family toxin [Hyphomicrobiales bacterium]|nr:BrnT family toxin [Hyphomicrobiales bacterium]MBV9591983.1 BrnT family toxin [Hyphomicrobiales bacterium]MBV9976839.1 BrnT family toxin [Hyphomicrobiales bacterium]
MVWDEAKRQANMDVHGYDFVDALRFPWDRAKVRETRPGLHGNKRFQAIGPMDGQLVSIVFGTLGTEGVSVLSMRPAGKKERRWHDE